MREEDLVRLVLGVLFLISLAIIIRLGENKAGRICMVVGVLHVLGGAWVGREQLTRILREGFFGQADSSLANQPGHIDKELAFWFCFWGLWTFMLGQLLSFIESRQSKIPEVVGWELIFFNLLAVLLIPKGGFYWLLIPGYLIVRAARRRK